MKPVKLLSLILRVIVLTLLLAFLFSVDFLKLRLSSDLVSALRSLLLMSFLQTIVLSYVIMRSRWSGWALVITIFFGMYGIIGFQPAIEAVVFLQDFQDIIPARDTLSLFLNAAIIAAVFSPLSVLILGKWHPGDQPPGPNSRLVMPWYSWLWKLILISFLYVVIYILFGALVFQPLAGDAFKEFYGDIQLPDWFLPFQFLRGLIWTIIALPVIRMMRGRVWEAGLAVALLFSFLMGFLLLLPNEFIPDEVRLAHLVEVPSSNFLFGWLVAAVLAPRDKPVPTDTNP